MWINCIYNNLPTTEKSPIASDISGNISKHVTHSMISGLSEGSRGVVVWILPVNTVNTIPFICYTPDICYNVICITCNN